MPGTDALPGIISVDDHLVEPPDLWVSQAPASLASRVPRVERGRAGMSYRGGVFSAWRDDDGEPCDWWLVGDGFAEVPTTRVASAVSWPPAERTMSPATFDEMRPGCFDPAARLADMDAAGLDGSLCFPTLPRFAGTLFLELAAADADLAAWCVRAYNDWMLDVWCAGAGAGRLFGVVIVPLWDPQLAAAEVRRCAARGAVSIAFTENPAKQSLPSIHTDHWDPLLAACEETSTVVSMHIGTSGMFSTAPDAPPLVSSALTHVHSSGAFCDWLLSGKLAQFPGLRIALAEGQVGWMPYQLERLDKVWEHNRAWGEVALDRPPSSFMPQVFGCVFDDEHGLANRDAVGMGQIMFETDYPHSDSTWPACREAAARVAAAGNLDDAETYLLLRGNAIRCFGLDRRGVAA
jgi:predicted TIM-barrel fold metal-dependent hydrolase